MMIKNFETLRIVSIALFILLVISMQANLTLSHETGQLRGKLESITTVDSLDNFVTVSDLCKEFELNKDKVYKGIREGVIPAIKVNKVLLVNKNIYKK